MKGRFILEKLKHFQIKKLSETLSISLIHMIMCSFIVTSNFLLALAKILGELQLKERAMLGCDCNLLWEESAQNPLRDVVLPIFVVSASTLTRGEFSAVIILNQFQGATELESCSFHLVVENLV